MSTTTDRTEGHRHPNGHVAQPPPANRRRVLRTASAAAAWGAGAVKWRRAVVLAWALLWLDGHVADAQDVDVFAGGGVVIQDTEYPVGNVGASVWVTPHLAVGGRIEWTDVYAVNLLSIHGRIRMSDGWELLVGTSPVGYVTGGGGFGAAPIIDVLGGRRVSSRFRVRFGASMLFSDGGHVYLFGQGVWSFN